MGCGSAKISLTHRRGGGKRRDGNTSNDSDTEVEEGAGGGSGQAGRHHQHQLRGSHKVRPASLVTSTSVDSQLLKTSSNRPKITTSFSQNDFSTTTSISGTSRIRVTLSHDGSLLEVETETFETLEEVDDDPDAIRAFHDNESSSNKRKSHSNPTSVTSRTRRSDRQEATVYPSCSGTQQLGSGSSSRVSDVRRLCGGGGGGGGGDSSSESSSRAGGVGGGGSVSSVRRLTSGGRECDTEDEEDYDNSTEVTAFIAVADIEVEPPPQPKKRATRSKSINSILSQAEEYHLHELELKPRRICKECGCIRNSSSSKEGSFYKGVGEQEVNTDKDKKAAAPKQESLIKRAAKSIERTPSATESSDGDIQKDVSRKSSRSGGSTPYKTASQQKRKSDKRKQLPDGASPLAIEKHTECCCYCHQKRRNKGISRTAQEGGDMDNSTTMVPNPNDPRHNNHSAPTGHRPEHHPGMSKNFPSDGSIKTKTNTGEKQKTSSSETPVDQVTTLPGTPESAQIKKMAWSKQNSADKLGPGSSATSGDKGRHKKDVRENMCESQRSFFTSNDSIVTVPVAPIVDPNAVFNFDDQEWAELALTNGNPPDVKSPSNSKLTNSIPTNNGTSSSKPKAMDFSKKQSKSNSKESRTKRASKLLLSSRSSSFAGNSSSSKSSTKSSSSDLPRIPSGLRSAASSGCVTDMDDGDVTDYSTTTTMTSSSSIGDVTSLAMAGICDTLDPTAVCLQVHSDFYNDFCDFFDDEDVGVD